MRPFAIVRSAIGYPPSLFAQRRCTAVMPMRCGAVRVSRLSPIGFHQVGRAKSAVQKRKDLLVGQAIFGVGTPEAVLVAVVALVVFGPKGLANIAKNTGQMLRSFAPTLRELAEVSTDLKSSLEQEIGLDEIRRDMQEAVQPSLGRDATTNAETDPSKNEPTVPEIDPHIDAKRAESAKLAWGNSRPSEVSENFTEETSPTSEPNTEKNLSAMTIEELEEELARRKSDNHKA